MPYFHAGINGYREMLEAQHFQYILLDSRQYVAYCEFQILNGRARDDQQIFLDVGPLSHRVNPDIDPNEEKVEWFVERVTAQVQADKRIRYVSLPHTYIDPRPHNRQISLAFSARRQRLAYEQLFAGEDPHRSDIWNGIRIVPVLPLDGDVVAWSWMEKTFATVAVTDLLGVEYQPNSGDYSDRDVRSLSVLHTMCKKRPDHYHVAGLNHTWMINRLANHAGQASGNLWASAAFENGHIIYEHPNSYDLTRRNATQVPGYQHLATDPCALAARNGDNISYYWRDVKHENLYAYAASYRAKELAPLF